MAKSVFDDTHSSLRAVEFYAGIGGYHYALKQTLGDRANVVAAIDINTTATEFYRQNFPSTPHFNRNICGLSVEWLDSLLPDIFVLSPPCQPFTRQGLKGDSSDHRTDSFFHLMETLLKMAHPPRYLMMENVEGFQDSQTRNHFVGILVKLGFVYQEFLLSPVQFGIPNSRLRYYLLAKRSPLDFIFQLKGQLLRDPSPLLAITPVSTGSEDNGTQLTMQTTDSKDSCRHMVQVQAVDINNGGHIVPQVHLGPIQCTLMCSSMPVPATGPGTGSPDLPATGPGTGSPDLPAIGTGTWSPDLPAIGTGTGSPDPPAIGTGTGSPDLSATDTGTGSPDLPATDTGTGSPDLPATDTGTGSPDLPATDPGTGSPDLPATDPGTESSDLPATDPGAQSPDPCTPVPLQPKPLSCFLQTISDADLPRYLVPPKVLDKCAMALDIVTHLSTRCCCFTKGYTHYAVGTGSVLYLGATPQLDEAFRDYLTGRSLGKEAGACVAPLKLRYFTPREVANLMCFPQSFSFPLSATQQQCYRVLGNSLNIHVVAALLKYLFCGVGDGVV